MNFLEKLSRPQVLFIVALIDVGLWAGLAYVILKAVK